MNKAAINGRLLPEMTARATSKAARTAMKTGAKGASIPYEPRRRGVTRSVIRVALSSRVSLHSDKPIFPGCPAPEPRLQRQQLKLATRRNGCNDYLTQKADGCQPLAS